MPELTDTEWRLLCVVVRSTLGWSRGSGAGGARKERDWLSHGQLKARTGRASEAVSRAVDGLVRKGLIEVADAAGRPIATAAGRRRHAGPLFFRLVPGTPGDQAGTERDDPSPPEPRGHAGQGTAIPLSEKDGRKTENREAGTTKENRTKPIPYGIAWDGGTTPIEHAPGYREARRFLREYAERFAGRHGGGLPPPILWGRDVKLVGQLLGTYPYGLLLELLDLFLASPEPWVRRSGYTLGAFRAAIASLLVRRAGQAQGGSPRTEARDGGWSRAGDCRRLPR